MTLMPPMPLRWRRTSGASTDDMRDLERRMENLENKMSFVMRTLARLSRWFGRRRVNAKSCMLSGPEAIAFKGKMAAHGVTDDDETRGGTPRRERVAR